MNNLELFDNEEKSVNMLESVFVDAIGSVTASAIESVQSDVEESQEPWTTSMCFSTDGAMDRFVGPVAAHPSFHGRWIEKATAHEPMGVNVEIYLQREIGDLPVNDTFWEICVIPVDKLEIENKISSLKDEIRSMSLQTPTILVALI